jgi:microcystin-dependent protein
MEGTIGEIRLFAGTFAPQSWLLCQGQLISISANQALYSILGTTYGGDGVQTFGLPNFAGRLATGSGQGPGLSNYVPGEMAGSEQVTILTSQLPAHIHSMRGNIQVGGASDGAMPEGTFPATAGSDIYAEAPNGGMMAAGIVSGTTSVTGSSQPLSIIQPYLAINVIICTEGVYPSRPD